MYIKASEALQKQKTSKKVLAMGFSLYDIPTTTSQHSFTYRRSAI